MQMAGAAPRRQAGHTSQGRIPAPGWLAVNDWQGMRAFEENPWVVDPPSGIVVNTNNRITDAAFPDHLSFDWGDTYRIIRAGRLLGDRQYHTRDSFVEIQTDAVSEAARTLLPLIARDLWYAGEPAEAGSAERRRQVALERLADWNGEMSEHAPEPLIYSAWMRSLKRRLAQDELGPLLAAGARRPTRSSSSGSTATSTAPAPGATSVQTTAVETCTDDVAAGARRRADRARGDLRAAARELALGRRAPGAAPAPDARRGAAAAPPREHPPVDAGRRPHAAARADRRAAGPSPT